MEKQSEMQNREKAHSAERLDSKGSGKCQEMIQRERKATG